MIAVMALFLVLLVACAPVSTLKAQPLNVSEPVKVDACANVQCGENLQCQAGSCVCASGFKTCGNSCIAESACCTDNDCGAEQLCQSGSCEERPTCKYNEEWDAKRKECVCADGTKWCAAQSECIPAKSCCEHIDCSDDQRCAPTTYSTSVCIKAESKKCKVIGEGKTGSYFFNEGRYDVKLNAVFEGKQFELMINNQTTGRVGLNDTIPVLLGDLWIENFQVFGGYCREDED